MDTRKLTFTPDWLQGRAMFGGLQCAHLVRAMTEAVDDAARAIRTLTVHYCAPVPPGEAELAVQVEHAGGSVTQVSGRIAREGRTLTTALATFARSRPDGRRGRVEVPPAVPPPEAVAELPFGPAFPVFSQHYAYRPCLGGVPYSGSTDTRTGGWCRLRAPFPGDAVAFAALADAWWPAVVPIFAQPAPSSTVDLTLHFVEPLPLAGHDPAAWYLVDTCAPTWGDGHAEQLGTLWTRDGRLLMRTRQWVAYFG